MAAVKNIHQKTRQEGGQGEDMDIDQGEEEALAAGRESAVNTRMMLDDG
jgi:hypothetical protein